MFKWLFRLLPKFLDTVPPGEMDGILLDFSRPHWEISCPKKGLLPEFLKALESLLPEGSILYLEGGYPSKKDEVLLKSMSVPEQAHVAMGTIWPRPQIFHIPATGENLEELARVAQNRAMPELAVHMHVYHGDRVLLQLHDAFDIPFYMAGEIPEERIKEFCRKLGVEYQRVEESEESSERCEPGGCQRCR
jgi:hypothetical protein